MKLMIASLAAGLALAGCTTPVAAPEPPRPVATYTLQPPPAVVAACFHRVISRAVITPAWDGLRVTVQGVPGAYAVIYASVDGTRAEIYETIATQAGMFKVGLDQCEQTLPRR